MRRSYVVCARRVFIAPTLIFLISCAVPADGPTQSIRRVSRGMDIPSLGSAQQLRVLGTEEGPEMLRHFPLSVSLLRSGGYLVADGREATIVGASDDNGFVGALGDGPGEYRSAMMTRIDPAGDMWIFDLARNRAVRYATRDSATVTLNLSSLGPVFDAAFRPSGELVVSALGGTRQNIGMRLHQYSFSEQSWSHHLPELRDSTFSLADRRLVRRLESLPDGGLLLVDPAVFRLQVVDPNQSWQVVDELHAGGGWWAEMWQDTTDGVPMIQDVFAVSSEEIWVLSSIPEDTARATATLDHFRATNSDGLASDAVDMTRDVVVEQLDAVSGTIVRAVRLHEYATTFVGPAVLSHYMGDLPFPRVEILSVNAPEN